jgi:predicted transcriptional regulator
MNQTNTRVNENNANTANDNDNNNNKDANTNTAIEWRRAKALELNSRGYSVVDIAKKLQVSHSTISRDLEHIRNESREVMQDYLTDTLPTDVRRTLIAMDDIIKTSWDISENAQDDKIRLEALRLVNNVMTSRTELLGNVGIIDKIIKLAEDIKNKNITNKGNE